MDTISLTSKLAAILQCQFATHVLCTLRGQLSTNCGVSPTSLASIYACKICMRVRYYSFHFHIYVHYHHHLQRCTTEKNKQNSSLRIYSLVRGGLDTCKPPELHVLSVITHGLALTMMQRPCCRQKRKVSMRTYRMKWKVHAVDHSNQNITKKTSNLLVTQKQNVSNARLENGRPSRNACL